MRCPTLGIEQQEEKTTNLWFKKLRFNNEFEKNAEPRLIDRWPTHPLEAFRNDFKRGPFIDRTNDAVGPRLATPDCLFRALKVSFC